MTEQHHENYTGGRRKNWIARAKEGGFSLSDSDNAPDTAIFVNMGEGDVVLACLKVINRFGKKMSNSKAQEDIRNIEKIVLAKVEPINDDIDMMIQSIQSSLVGVFGSCRCYIDGRVVWVGLDR